MKKILLQNKFFYYFYKRFKIFKNSSKNLHLGEYGEDIFVRRFFKNTKKGLYVDVGCYHPIKGSLTNYLYESGWNGVNVDLSQASIDLFNISRPKDKNIRAAITDYDGNTHYHENGLINQQNSLEGKSENKIDIKAYKLNTLLEELGIDKFNFLNIDAEGHDFKVISEFNFDKYRPQLISIEHNSYNLDDILSSDIHILISKNKYFLASKFGVTSIYIDSVYKDKMNKLMSI